MNLFKRFTLLFVAALTATVLFSCQKITASHLVQSEYTYYQYLDTVSSIQVWDTKSYGTEPEAQLWVDIGNILANIDNTFWRDKRVNSEQSELYKLNESAGSGVPFPCSSGLYDVIKVGMTYAAETQGKLDPAIGPLVDLWGITDQDMPDKTAPSQDEINSLLPLVNYKLVQLDDAKQTVLLPKKGMVIDLGAISKGYAADQVYNYLKSKGIKHALIDLGGNLYALGDRFAKNSDGSDTWTIGIRDPRIGADPNHSIASLSVIDKTIVTSGVYEKYFYDAVTGKFYSHILDPDTGYPVNNNLASVSIITDNSTHADALSTSLFALGLDAGMAFIENNPDIEAVFVTKDNKVYVSSGVISKYNFKITDSDFTLVPYTAPSVPSTTTATTDTTQTN